MALTNSGISFSKQQPYNVPWRLSQGQQWDPIAANLHSQLLPQKKSARIRRDPRAPLRNRSRKRRPARKNPNGCGKDSRLYNSAIRSSVRPHVLVESLTTTHGQATIGQRQYTTYPANGWHWTKSTPATRGVTISNSYTKHHQHCCSAFSSTGMRREVENMKDEKPLLDTHTIPPCRPLPPQMAMGWWAQYTNTSIIHAHTTLTWENPKTHRHAMRKRERTKEPGPRLPARNVPVLVDWLLRLRRFTARSGRLGVEASLACW